MRISSTISALLATAGATSWQSLPGSNFAPGQPWGYAPEASWPPTYNNGSALVPQAPDRQTQHLVAQVDAARLKRTVTKLVSFGTRHTLSQQNSTTRGIGAARDWLLREMQGIAGGSDGNMDVFFNSYIQPVASRILFPVNITNVVARINGTTDPNRVYVVTGHYDSRRIDINDYTNDAPGADDDASGVALVLEMARICAKLKPAATMIFAAVAGEEQGLYGSNNLAGTLKNQSFNVEGNWNNDIVGQGSFLPTTPINPHTIRLFGASLFYPNASSTNLLQTTALIGGENDSPARNLGRFIAEVAAGAVKYLDMQVALIYRPDRFLRGGDHQSFLSKGFPAVRFTEAVEDYKHQHQDPRVQDGVVYGDNIEFVNFEYLQRVTRTNLATMWSAATAPGMPKNVTISQSVGVPATFQNTSLAVVNNLSRFNWNTGNDTLVASYELVWRVSGALQWSHYLNAGNVGTTTVDLPKDDLQFGVRAVGKDGKKSPAVFPLPL
ncbi:hypothetical protein LTR95_008847 [Oleoguttula sp. CCFEE 5521]